jgi:Zn-dependent alcohol dehydrogenase
MKALVLNAIGRGFELEDVDIAQPIGREVLVNVKALRRNQCQARHPDVRGAVPARPNNLNDLVSKRIALRDVNDGYAALKDGSLTRVVVTSF